MFLSTATMKQSRKIQVLHQIQSANSRGEQPKPRAVGLKEKEFQEMADEGLFELRFSGSNPQWFDYEIAGLSETAKGLLSNSEPLPPSLAAKIFRVLASGFWDLLKIAFGAVIGWYLKKYYG